MKQAKDNKPETPKDTGPSVQVQDAWDDSYKIAQGLDDILSAAACSDNGLMPEGCKMLGIAAEQLVEHMKMVNSFFNPDEHE